MTNIHTNITFSGELHHPEIDRLKAENAKLRAALELWHLATNINITMEGPQYMGVSFILGRQAWERTRAALEGDT